MSDDAKQPAQTGPLGAGDAPASVEPNEAARPRERIRIGSQRQATGVVRAKPQPLLTDRPPLAVPADDEDPLSEAPATAEAFSPESPAEPPGDAAPGSGRSSKKGRSGQPRPAVAEEHVRKFPPPRSRDALTEEMQQEFEAALGGVSIEELLTAGTGSVGVELEPESLHRGRVLSLRGPSAFIELPSRNQGLVPLSQFAEPPEPGTMIEVAVLRFDPAEGLYELTIPDAAVSVAGWSQISEGMVVEAVVTGHNQGGLEAEVNKLRGFIPMSQIAIVRVETPADYVGQRLTCVVVEVNPDSQKLVLSRRAMLERERAEAKTRLMAEIEIGQTREGVVTRLQPFGAFVDLGGIDGLVHVSQMSWDRVADPSTVLKVGQRIKVRVTKVDPETGKIGLSYRESWENPWDSVASRYQPKTTATGTVTKLMDFGAFVRLEAGVEGLIHISELAHRRVFRAGDVVHEGQEVEVLVLSVDTDEQRISLSLKALEARPEPATKDKQSDEPLPSPPIPQRKSTGPLKGGVDRPSGGAGFGLKW